jgi:hypothetical protein
LKLFPKSWKKLNNYFVGDQFKDNAFKKIKALKDRNVLEIIALEKAKNNPLPLK